MPRQLRIDEDLCGFSDEQLTGLIYMGQMQLQQTTLTEEKREGLMAKVRLLAGEFERRQLRFRTSSAHVPV